MSSLNSAVLPEAREGVRQNDAAGVVVNERDPFLIALHREIEAAVAADEQAVRAMPAPAPARPDRPRSDAAADETRRERVRYAYD